MDQAAERRLRSSVFFEDAEPEKSEVILHRIHRVHEPQRGIQFEQGFGIILLSVKQSQLPRHIAGMYVERAGELAGGEIFPDAEIHTVLSHHPPQEHVDPLGCRILHRVTDVFFGPELMWKLKKDLFELVNGSLQALGFCIFCKQAFQSTFVPINVLEGGDKVNEISSVEGPVYKLPKAV